MAADSPQSVTRLINSLGSAETAADGVVFARVTELLRSAAVHWASRQSPVALPATELVHEAYLKLFGQGPVVFENRLHFFSTAALAMQQILIDLGRRQEVRRRHAAAIAHSLGIDDGDASWDGIETFSAVLNELQHIDPMAAELIRLRFFAGLSEEEASLATGVPLRTLQRKWKATRGWLAVRLREHPHSPESS